MDGEPWYRLPIRSAGMYEPCIMNPWLLLIGFVRVVLFNSVRIYKNAVLQVKIYSRTKRGGDMPRRTLESLGTIVRERRGHRKLREVAEEIRISPATLMRVETGRIPDVGTFGKICAWLSIDPGSFLGFDEGVAQPSGLPAAPSSLLISAHLKADQLPHLETVSALATLILLAAKTQAPTPSITSNDET